MSQIKELPEFFSMQTSQIKELEYEDERSQNSLAKIARFFRNPALVEVGSLCQY